MIVYLATYPRCGNSFLRGMIVANWQYRVVDIHDGDWSAMKSRLARFAIADAPEPEPSFPDGLLWGEWIATYTADGERRRMLKPGCKKWLTPEVRQRLAAERNIFFAKTHDRPFDRYFPGESVIQMVRHPIASIWSYKNLLETITGKDYDIHKVSAGDVIFGSWSDYHADWMARHPASFLRVRFEDAHRREHRVTRRIARFLGLPLDTVKKIDFAAYQRVSPVRFRAGEVDGWRRHIKPRAILAIADQHRAVAKSLGYRLPRGDRSFVVRYVARQIHRVRSTKLVPPNNRL